MHVVWGNIAQPEQPRIVELELEQKTSALAGRPFEKNIHLEVGFRDLPRIDIDLDGNIRRFLLRPEGARRIRVLEGKILGVLHHRIDRRCHIGLRGVSVSLSVSHRERFSCAAAGSTDAGLRQADGGWGDYSCVRLEAGESPSWQARVSLRTRPASFSKGQLARNPAGPSRSAPAPPCQEGGKVAGRGWNRRLSGECRFMPAELLWP